VNKSVKQDCSTNLRWQLGVLEKKKICMHERDVQEVDGNVFYLKSKCLTVGNGAVEKKRQYTKKLEATHSF